MWHRSGYVQNAVPAIVSYGHWKDHNDERLQFLGWFHIYTYSWRCTDPHDGQHCVCFNDWHASFVND